MDAGARNDGQARVNANQGAGGLPPLVGPAAKPNTPSAAPPPTAREKAGGVFAERLGAEAPQPPPGKGVVHHSSSPHTVRRQLSGDLIVPAAINPLAASANSPKNQVYSPRPSPPPQHPPVTEDVEFVSDYDGPVYSKLPKDIFISKNDLVPENVMKRDLVRSGGAIYYLIKGADNGKDVCVTKECLEKLQKELKIPISAGVPPQQKLPRFTLDTPVQTAAGRPAAETDDQPAHQMLLSLIRAPGTKGHISTELTGNEILANFKKPTAKIGSYQLVGSTSNPNVIYLYIKGEPIKGEPNIIMRAYQKTPEGWQRGSFDNNKSFTADSDKFYNSPTAFASDVEAFVKTIMLGTKPDIKQSSPSAAPADRPPVPARAAPAPTIAAPARPTTAAQAAAPAAGVGKAAAKADVVSRDDLWKELEEAYKDHIIETPTQAERDPGRLEKMRKVLDDSIGYIVDARGNKVVKKADPVLDFKFVKSDSDPDAIQMYFKTKGGEHVNVKYKRLPEGWAIVGADNKPHKFINPENPRDKNADIVYYAKQPQAFIAQAMNARIKLHDII